MTDPTHTKLRSLHTGHDDGLEPLRALDVARGRLGGRARARHGGDRLRRPQPRRGRRRARGDGARPRLLPRAAPISGAMTIAKQGLVVCEMIDRGWVQAIVATGALMTHGFVEGGRHAALQAPPVDEGRGALREGLQPRLRHARARAEPRRHREDRLARCSTALPEGITLASHMITEALGRYLDAHTQRPRDPEERGARRACRSTSRPSPTRSSGSTSRSTTAAREGKGLARRPFDPFLDLEHYTDQIRAHETIGIFTIGGGVPRNWAQQVGPYLEISEKRLGIDEPVRRFRYGVRICPEPVHWGGLSGCTYSEGVSWGKFVPPRRGRPLRRGAQPTPPSPGRSSCARCSSESSASRSDREPSRDRRDRRRA